jgi:hypothetical protein
LHFFRCGKYPHSAGSGVFEYFKFSAQFVKDNSNAN